MERPTLTGIYNKIKGNVENTYNMPKSRNKGAHGILLENLVGIPTSSACLDCIDGELKSYPLKYDRKNILVPKETICVTMLSKDELISNEFGKSKCYKKLKNVLYTPYIRNVDMIQFNEPKIINLTPENNKLLYDTLESDYEKIRQYYITNSMLSGSSKNCKYLETRTKGAGGDKPKTYAFYLKTGFIKDFLLN